MAEGNLSGENSEPPSPDEPKTRYFPSGTVSICFAIASFEDDPWRGIPFEIKSLFS
jgi:hypothetical protein